MQTSNKYSNYKIVWFNDKLVSLRDNIITPPIYVRIKLTNRCCHNCFFCVYRIHGLKSWKNSMHNHVHLNDELSKDKVFEVLDDFKEMGVKAVTYSGGGEPLLHKNVVDIFNKTKTNGIDLSVITNGQLLNGRKAEALKDAKWVRISMDYYDRNSFVESRGCTKRHYNDIIKNISRFVTIKNKCCDVSVNFIITQKNYKHIVDVTILLKDLGVSNIRFSPVWLDDFINYHRTMEKDVMRNLDMAKEYESDSFKIYNSYNITNEQSKREYNKCYVQQIIPAIGADYNVYNCHNKSYDSDAIIGNIRKQSFKKMWFSKRTRKHFMEFDPMINCNCQCANDAKNKFLHCIINSYGDNYV